MNLPAGNVSGQLPLHGVTVVELGRVLAAPFCSMILADAGAEVIKVEMPNTGDDSRAYGPPFLGTESVYFLSLNRSKRSLTLDLRIEEARSVLLRLLGRVDVFLHNFRSSAIERMGLGYESLGQVNPRLVYCGISGYGDSGPRRDQPALDMIIQVEAGVASLNGFPDSPPARAAIPLSDLAAGMYAAFAISAALHQRSLTGRGQRVSTSLLESTVSLLCFHALQYFATGNLPGRYGNAHPSVVPYDVFQTRDARLAIAVVNESLWNRFCAAIGLPSLAQNDRFRENARRVVNRESLYDILLPRLAEISAADLFKALSEAGVPVGYVNDLTGTFGDPQVQSLRLRRQEKHPTLGEVDLLAPPFHFSEGGESALRAPPLLGQHTRAILEELGYSPEEIDGLKSLGATSLPEDER